MQSLTRLDLMTVYIIAQLKFTQRELYDRYQSRFAEVFRKFRGRLPVADERPEVLERLSFPTARRQRSFTDRPNLRRSRPTARPTRSYYCCAAKSISTRNESEPSTLGH
jgi:uncharacterized protein (DUF1330 family)